VQNTVVRTVYGNSNFFEVKVGMKRGGTSEDRVENGKMDVWCEVTR